MFKTLLMIAATAVIGCWIAGVRPADIRRQIVASNESASARFSGNDGKNDWGGH